MQEIKCPNCGKTFVVDDSGYAQIARQVRDSEFDRALRQRERDIAEAKEKELELAQMRQKEAFDRALAEAERRVEQLKAQLAGGDEKRKNSWPSPNLAPKRCAKRRRSFPSRRRK